MQRVVLGANGTVGKVLCELLGSDVYKWNRHKIPLSNFDEVASKLRLLKPDVIYNLAVASSPTHQDENSSDINVELPRLLAKLSKELNFRLIHTSTVMVFSDNAKGPFFPESTPDAIDGYGLDKKLAEEAILSEKGNSVIARLGWQIGQSSGSNNMIDFLERAAKEGSINASSKWLPSCSFLEDTAKCLKQLEEQTPGIYHINANQKLSFYEIVMHLKKARGANWKVIETEDFVYNQVMQDNRISIPQLFS